MSAFAAEADDSPLDSALGVGVGILTSCEKQIWTEL